MGERLTGSQAGVAAGNAVSVGPKPRSDAVRRFEFRDAVAVGVTSAKCGLSGRQGVVGGCAAVSAAISTGVVQTFPSSRLQATRQQPRALLNRNVGRRNARPARSGAGVQLAFYAP